MNGSAAIIVQKISNGWLGTIGGLLAMLGVIAAPITSGDTAFRSARLIIADFMKISQKTITKRLLICIPMFIVAMAILIYSLKDKDGFEIIWRYFAWSNQTLAVFTLWAITVFLAQKKKLFIITLIPALFMTCVTSTYILFAPEGLQLPYPVALGISITFSILCGIWFIYKQLYKKRN